MSTYTASARVDGGALHTSRPLTAPEKVIDLVESLLYEVQHGDGTVVSFEIVIESADTSQTPIGDSAQATATLPLEEPEPEPGAYPPPLGTPAAVDADAAGSAVTR